MLIYRCDACGLEHRHAQIIGNHFAFMPHFETLAPSYRPDGVVDVCKRCYDKITTAAQKAEHQADVDASARRAEALKEFARP